MKITIRKPIGYTHIGRKDQQEDAVWPAFDKVTPENRCFVLCDGVGGSAHGEIASQTASKVIGEYLTSLLKEKGIVDDADVQDAVTLAYDELEKIDSEDSVNGQPSMATTLTCVCIHDEGILAAHMGDSRIYLVRPGQGLLYQSSDHSLVNALLQAGELTLEEAKNFPRKNVITKAIQPHAQKRFNAEVHQLTDVRSGDYIFMCCDGVLEQLTNERLVEILSLKCSDEKKLALLEAESTDRTKDNYTAYLIPIDKVEGESKLVNDDEVATVEVETTQQKTTVTKTATPNPPTIYPPKPPVENSKKKLILMAVGIIAIASIIFCIGRYSINWFGSDPQPPVIDNPEDSIQSDGAKSVEGQMEESPDADEGADETDVSSLEPDEDSTTPTDDDAGSMAPENDNSQQQPIEGKTGTKKDSVSAKLSNLIKPKSQK